ncbi:hypothetical protein QL093DRAFT_2167648 [Fusarium oxysporum]|nr:hypothetical protein QL093DRAFT_2167648 [Fusarium oxysporum]
MQEVSIHEYIRAKTATENHATSSKSNLQFNKRISQCPYGRPISPAPPRSESSGAYSQKPSKKGFLDL